MQTVIEPVRLSDLVTSYVGDAKAVLRSLPENSIQCCVTSPPYFGLRSYLPKDHPDKGKEVGLEKTSEQYVAELVDVFREVRRVLRDDGTLFLNLGDSYANGGRTYRAADKMRGDAIEQGQDRPVDPPGVKPKDLMGIPWTVAFTLRDDGWYLRSGVPWVKRNCLSGGTVVYARTQKGEMPTTVKDLVRLDPETVQLWDGEKWNQVAHFTESESREGGLEIEFRNGQRIGCTPEHRWPTQRGNVEAKDLRIGDVVKSCRLPQPGRTVDPAGLPAESVGWLVGFFLAEGHVVDEREVIFSIHKDEEGYYRKLQEIAAYFGVTCRRHPKTDEDGVTVAMSGPTVVGVIKTYVWGDDCYTKHLTRAAWERGDDFLTSVLQGYLEGDGHYEATNARWRLGFCENDALAADLRCVGGRLGIRVRLRRKKHNYQGGETRGWRGEVRFVKRANVPGGFAQTDDGEIVAIRKSRARKFWDIGVENEPHLFALASGILTHNSMPESVEDRPGSSLEYVFLLTKSPTYFYDKEAVKKPCSTATLKDNRIGTKREGDFEQAEADYGGTDQRSRTKARNATGNKSGRNRRNGDWWFESVGAFHHPETGELLGFDVVPKSYKGAHFACVDASTECLTKRGWLTHDCLSVGDEIAQFDVDKETISWGKVSDLHRYEVIDQEMVKVSNRTFDMLLTPNHRTVVSIRHKKTRKWQPYKVIRADELADGHAIPRSGTFDGEGDKPVTPDWAELIGWYVAEGCQSKARWAVEIYQSRSANPEKVDRIRHLLTSVGAEFSEASHVRAWRGEDRECVSFQVRGFAASMHRQWAPGKRLHPETLAWDGSLLTRLLDGLVDGDGHRRPDGRFNFTQKDKATADIVAGVAVLLGYTVNTRPSLSGWVVYFTRQTETSLRGPAGKGGQIGTESYTGVVWCPTVPTGAFVARRNGKVFVTGNCFPPDLIRPMILAGTSAGGCCSECGRPQRRVERERVPTRPGDDTKVTGDPLMDGNRDPLRHVTETKTVGWNFDCDCTPTTAVPCTVLDPFFGSGTVGQVCQELGVRCVGIDLNGDYLKLQRERIEKVCSQ